MIIVMPLSFENSSKTTDVYLKRLNFTKESLVTSSQKTNDN
jgi:hypothetical protein